VTATGQLMGTMRYLAPEQLRGAASTPASDLHSLAAVAYEMLAGRHAYDVSTPVALAEAQAAGPAPIATVSPAVDAVVRRALAVDPADRPESVAAFADALEAAVAAEPTAVIPIEPVVVATAPTRAADVAVASPARAAAIHGPVPAAAGLADRSAGTLEEPRVAGVSAWIGVALALLFMVGFLVAALSSDLGTSAATGASPRATDPTAPPTPAATPAPKKPGHGHGHGGNGGGDG